jgi:hypothetical protein
MIVFTDCDKCINRTNNKGFQMACRAFPNGIPYGFEQNNVRELKECKNGIKFEERTKAK